MALRLSSLRWLQVLRNFAKHSKSCLQRLVGACACILLLDRGCDVIRLPPSHPTNEHSWSGSLVAVTFICRPPTQLNDIVCACHVSFRHNQCSNRLHLGWCYIVPYITLALSYWEDERRTPIACGTYLRCKTKFVISTHGTCLGAQIACILVPGLLGFVLLRSILSHASSFALLCLLIGVVAEIIREVRTLWHFAFLACVGYRC